MQQHALSTGSRMVLGMRHVVLLAVVVVLGASIAAAQDYVIKFKSPADGETYKLGDKMSIIFALESPKSAASQGNLLQLEYSTGKSWSVIASSLDPSTTSYTWTIPGDLAGGTYQVRVTEYITKKGATVTHQIGYSGKWTLDTKPACAPVELYSTLMDVKTCAGQPVVLSMSSNAKDAFYEWRRDGKAIATTLGGTYTIVNPGTADQGMYDVRVYLACGEQKFSNSMWLTITPTVSITSQPTATTTLCEGESTEFVVQATGSITGYQWRKNGVAIKGETTNRLRVPNAQPASAGVYDVVITGTCQPSATSTSATLNVNSPPRIVSHPEPLALCNGSNGQISVAANGGELSYQWFHNGKAVAGGNGPVLAFNNFSPSMSGDYQCVIAPARVVSAACAGTVYSRTVRVSSFVPPTITMQPTAVRGCQGGSAAFTAAATGTGLSFQWLKDGSPIAGATSNSYVIENVTPASTGSYSVRVTGTCGLVATSSSAVLTLTVPPAVTGITTDQTVNVGSPIDLTVDAANAEQIQWMRNHVVIPGATQATYSIEAATMNDGGSYNAILRSSCGAVATPYVRVRVIDPTALRPELTLAQAAIDLGDVPVGYDRRQTIATMIANTGDAPLTVSAVTVTGAGLTAETSQRTPFTLQPGETSAVTVQAAASATGAITGTLTVQSNAPVPTATATLSAMGVLRYSLPALVDYSNVVLPMTKDICLDVTNTSGVDIVLDNLSISGTNAALFSIAGPTTNIAITAGATARVCATFAPSAVGPAQAVLTITSSTGGNTTATLQGTGEANTSVAMDAESMGITVHPNPMMNDLTIALGTMQPTSATVVDINGRTVAHLAATPGVLSWNGMDASGQRVAAGTYAVVLQDARGFVTVPVVVLP